MHIKTSTIASSKFFATTTMPIDTPCALEPAVKDEQYDLLWDLTQMKLNIKLRQLLALVLEYTANLWSVCRKEGSASTIVVPGTCQAKVCAN